MLDLGILQQGGLEGRRRRRTLLGCILRTVAAVGAVGLAAHHN